MPRENRIEYENAIHHVTQRGNGRQALFLTSVDYRVFIATLTEVVERYHWQILSYCLMPNHVHLLVRTPETNLSRGMRKLTGSYPRRFNKVNGYTGHIFQGRFGSELVEDDDHLITVFGYLALNAVRAGLVARPEHWLWGAHAELVGDRAGSMLIDRKDALSIFGSRPAVASKRYAKYVEQLGSLQAEDAQGARRAGSG